MEDIAIVNLCKKKDVSGYKMIYEKYEQSLLRTAFRMLKNHQDAEDAVQKTFLNLYRGINNFSFRSKFSTYLYKILINVCYDILAKEKKYVKSSMRISDPQYTSQTELRFSLENAIEQLPNQMRACFVLFAIEGFKQKEIAKILALSIGGVKSNIFNAKYQLRAKLISAKKEVV